MRLFASSLRALLARAGAISMAMPILIGGAAPATIASHAMTPAIDSIVQFQEVASIDPAATADVRVGCQNGIPGIPLCYSPQQIRTAYNFDALYAAGFTGAGKTIVIVDAFQNPFVERDLHLFDVFFGLPDPPAFHISAPDGLTPFVFTNANQRLWSGEIALDTQWAHSIAPGARIELVLAASDRDDDMNSALAYAVDNNLGDVISMSFGEGEACMAAADKQRINEIFKDARKKGITLIASSGDQGAAQPSCTSGGSNFLSASIPASHPLVTGVGGTNLSANTTSGAYISETAWNDAAGKSGGGFSTVFRRPSYQKKKDGLDKMRGVPDVAYSAGLNGGVLVAFSTSGATPYGVPGLFIFAGTSAGSPQWSALIAIADQRAGRRLGGINGTIYDLGRDGSSAFHDITTGNNIVGVGGYNAASGWDPVTGWGTPDAGQLVPLLAAAGPDRSEGH